MNTDATIFVVDDDASMRKSLLWLLRSAGWRAEAFASAEDFLARPLWSGPGCLILDVRMPQLTGPQLRDRLAAAHSPLPIIFLTDAGSEQTAVNAFRHGARNYFKKPFDMFELKRNIEDILEMKRSSSECRAPMRIDSVKGDDQTVCDLPEIPPQLLRSVRYIKENFNGHITIDVLASEAGLSKYHFCRKFRTALGSSPMNFVTLMRIERAKEEARRILRNLAGKGVGVDHNPELRCGWRSTSRDRNWSIVCAGTVQNSAV